MIKTSSRKNSFKQLSDILEERRQILINGTDEEKMKVYEWIASLNHDE